MAKASLPTSLIVNKIRTSKNNFNTSTGELIRLRLQQPRVPAEADPNDPIAAHEAGIYLFEEKMESGL